MIRSIWNGNQTEKMFVGYFSVSFHLYLDFGDYLFELKGNTAFSVISNSVVSCWSIVSLKNLNYHKLVNMNIRNLFQAFHGFDSII